MQVKWIKVSTDIFNDEKIMYIETMPNGDEILVIWLKILALCGRSNSDGLLMMTSKIPYTDEMLASIFRKDIKSIQLALKVFEQLDMVEMYDNAIFITNWQKHQSLDKLESKREYDRQYQQKKRDAAKASLENRTINRIENNDNRTLDIDIEEDIDIYKKENIKEKSFEAEASTRSPKKKKSHYGEYKNVLLSEDEFQKISDREDGEDLIEFLDEYIERKGYKAKSHYLCLTGWVADAVKERKQKSGNGYKAPPPKQSYSSDDMKIPESVQEAFRKKLEEKGIKA